MDQEINDNNAIEGFPKDLEKPEAPKKWHTQQAVSYTHLRAHET